MHRMLIRIGLAATLAVGASAMFAGFTYAGDTRRDTSQHCFAELAQKRAGQAESNVIRTTCVQGETAASAFASQDGIYVLFIVYQNPSYGGNSYQWYSTTGCAGDYGYNDFNVIGWNDQASSAEAACGRWVNLWEHTYQMGSSLLITGLSPSLGIMNDESSSWDTAN